MTATQTLEAEPSASQGHGRLLHRFRLAAVAFALSALAFLQEPGRIAADTKLDLAIDPGGFLARSLTIWEPSGFFGQLQNQAYGYLFPVGPFFLLGDLAGLPAWVVQRLAWSALLVTAFLGVVRLCRLLGIRSDAAAIIAGISYALAPRMVTEIGVLSVEVLPFAVAPWVLIPLVAFTDGRYTTRRAAALSGIAVLFAGGVNAVATLAVLPLGVLWILMRLRGRPRWTLAAWWSLSVALATLWWLVPLAILGLYSPPFLDWIESSSVTTLLTAPDVVLRGTSQWVAYVADAGGPVWPGGWLLVSTPLLVAAAGVVATVGLVGIALRSAPHRAFLAATLLLGFVIVSLGHMGPVEGLGADWARAALDGVLAPFRNTHKADLLIRLPIALGIGFFVEAVVRRWVRRAGPPARTLIVARSALALLVALILLGAWPLANASAARDRSFESIPLYWSEVADWLAQESPTGRALIVPSASFGVYSWGRTQDEPLQALGASPWAVRDAVPLSSAGNIRWLDAVQERLDSGRGAPGLADALARAGVTFLVVRNDIDQRRTGAPRPALVRQALVRSGGFTPVAGFGPALPPYRTETTVVDDGLQDTVAAVEVWQVDSAYAPDDPRLILRPVDDAIVVSGSAEALLALSDVDEVGHRAVVVDGDEGPLVAAGIDLARGITDGFRRTEVNVGAVRNNRSATLTAEEPFAQDRAVHDYLPVEPAQRQSYARYDGGAVLASSSGATATALRGRNPGAAAWNAVDGDPATAWISGDLHPGVGQWWQFSSDQEFTAESIQIRLVVGDPAGAAPEQLTVTTDAGALTVPVEATDLAQEVPLPAGPTRTLRLTLASVDGGGGGEGFGIREVSIPGLSAPIERRVVAPGVADGGPIVLQARQGERPGCVAVGSELVCTPSLVVSGEERSGISRRITVATDGQYRVRVWVRPKAGAALDGLLKPISSTAPIATATSVSTSDPAARPQAAVDGVASTAWIASALDAKPELRIDWSEPRLVRGVRLVIAPGLVASRPLSVTTIVNGRETPSVISDSGVIRFPAQETDSLTLRFENLVAVRSLDPDTGAVTTLPVGVSDIRLIGASDLDSGPRLSDTATVPCGFGPTLVVDGTTALESRVEASVSDVLTDRLLPAQPCDGRLVTLTAGVHDLDLRSTEEFAVDTVVLEPVTQTPLAVPSGSDARVLEWHATQRAVDIDGVDESRLLETTENANGGWSASIDGTALTPVRVDGWRQAWIVPPGLGGTVTLVYEPSTWFHSGLIVGLIGALLLVSMALVRSGAPAPALAPVEPRRQWPLAAAGVLAGVLVAGVPGGVVASAAVAIALVVRRTWLIAGAGVVAAIGAALMPWPATFAAPRWSQVVVSLAAVVAVTSISAPWRRSTSDGSSAEAAAPQETRMPMPPGPN